MILLHGWPYDIHSYVDVVPLLAAKGYRVLVPYLRGYGSTRFLSADGLRNGQQAALASDVIDLMDSLKISTAVIAGFDWGSRTANVVAALWPQRTSALVAVSGYTIQNLEDNKLPLPLLQSRAGGISTTSQPTEGCADTARTFMTSTS